MISCRRIFAGLLAALTLTQSSWLLAAATELPELGDSAQASLSPQTQQRLGESFYNDLRLHDPAYLDDPEITGYVNRVGQRLVSASANPTGRFTFFVLRDRQINAFATFGGYVGVNTGLLLASQSESEFAGVLAHEISHVNQHHLARGIQAAQNQSIGALASLALLLLAARSGQEGGQLAQGASAALSAASIQSQLAYSRDFEREADRVGFQTLTKAGYDPHGMADFFERLQKSTAAYENNAPVYLRTHPLTTERISDMEARALNAPYKLVKDSLDFYLVRAKLRAMEYVPQEVLSNFEEQLRERRYTYEAAVWYGIARAQLRLNHLAEADKALSQARRGGANAMFDVLAAEIRLAAKDVSGATQIYRDAYRRYPQNGAIVLGLVNVLQQQGQNEAAVQILEDRLRTDNRNPRLYQLQAQSYAALGKSLQSRRATAESYALSGQTQAAVEQLELAQREARTFYDQSIIDTRLKALRSRLFEERREARQDPF